MSPSFFIELFVVMNEMQRIRTTTHPATIPPISLLCFPIRDIQQGSVDAMRFALALFVSSFV